MMTLRDRVIRDLCLANEPGPAGGTSATEIQRGRQQSIESRLQAALSQLISALGFLPSTAAEILEVLDKIDDGKQSVTDVRTGTQAEQLGEFRRELRGRLEHWREAYEQHGFGSGPWEQAQEAVAATLRTLCLSAEAVEKLAQAPLSAESKVSRLEADIRSVVVGRCGMPLDQFNEKFPLNALNLQWVELEAAAAEPYRAELAAESSTVQVLQQELIDLQRWWIVSLDELKVICERIRSCMSALSKVRKEAIKAHQDMVVAELLDTVFRWEAEHAARIDEVTVISLIEQRIGTILGLLLSRMPLPLKLSAHSGWWGDRLAARKGDVWEALVLMEESVDRKLPIAEIVSRLNIGHNNFSRKSLERAFRRHIGDSPASKYRELRRSRVADSLQRAGLQPPIAKNLAARIWMEEPKIRSAVEEDLQKLSLLCRYLPNRRVLASHQLDFLIGIQLEFVSRRPKWPGYPKSLFNIAGFRRAEGFKVVGSVVVGKHEAYHWACSPRRRWLPEEGGRLIWMHSADVESALEAVALAESMAANPASFLEEGEFQTQEGTFLAEMPYWWGHDRLKEVLSDCDFQMKQRVNTTNGALELANEAITVGMGRYLVQQAEKVDEFSPSVVDGIERFLSSAPFTFGYWAPYKRLIKLLESRPGAEALLAIALTRVEELQTQVLGVQAPDEVQRFVHKPPGEVAGLATLSYLMRRGRRWLRALGRSDPQAYLRFATAFLKMADAQAMVNRGLGLRWILSEILYGQAALDRGHGHGLLSLPTRDRFSRRWDGLPDVWNRNLGAVRETLITTVHNTDIQAWAFNVLRSQKQQIPALPSAALCLALRSPSQRLSAHARATIVSQPELLLEVAAPSVLAFFETCSQRQYSALKSFLEPHAENGPLQDAVLAYTEDRLLRRLRRGVAVEGAPPSVRLLCHCLWFLRPRLDPSDVANLALYLGEATRFSPLSEWLGTLRALPFALLAELRRSLPLLSTAAARAMDEAIVVAVDTDQVKSMARESAGCLAAALKSTPGRIDKDKGFAVACATCPDPELQGIAIKRLEARRLVGPLLVPLAESGMPAALAAAERFVRSMRDRTELTKAVITLCDSGSRAVRGLGLDQISRFPERLDMSAVITALSEHTSPEILECVARWSGSGVPVKRDALRRFDSRVLRMRRAGRKAKELVKARLQADFSPGVLSMSTRQGYAQDTQVLIEMARSGVLTDRDWALQQLARLALDGDHRVAWVQVSRTS